MPEPVNREGDARVDGGDARRGVPVPADDAAAAVDPAARPRPRPTGFAGRLLSGLGALICPPRCLVCGEPGADGEDACAACRAALPWNRRACLHCALPLPRAAAEDPPPRCRACRHLAGPLHEVHAAFVYRFPLDRLLPRFKFHQDLASGRQLSAWMAMAFAAAPRPDALVPVPLHASRLRRRGYDQTLELARPLARELWLPLRTDLLRRVRATGPQSRLDAAARGANLRGAFAGGRSRRRSLPAHVALVDDVMTTGATLREAAAVLREAGIARVDAWVCARAP